MTAPFALPFPPPRPLTHRLTCALLLALLCSACSPRDAAAPVSSAASAASSPASGTGAAASAPPVSVTTVRAQLKDVPVQLTATGTVAPLSSVEVKPQVSSVVTQVHIREGQFVRAGEPLFTLDARADEANVARARAQLARDEAGLADARRQLARSRELLAQNFVSQGALDANQAAVDAQAALVAADRAAVDAALVPLSYARVRAPGAGRVGAINVYVGSSVQANQTTLVTITQLDPIAIAFNLPQRHLADALVALQGGGAAVSATLPEGGTPLSGRLRFVDNAVDATSGTVKVKAQFDNRGGKLWPGAFVNVALTVRSLAGAVVVPQAAIVQSARGPLVYVVQEGRAAARPVQLLFAQGEDAAVSGLRAGERVVLDGRQNLRPGAAVVERNREGGEKGAGGGGSGARGGTSAASGASAPRRTAPAGQDAAP
ncbi:efflux RND transporter periplasmic adaptor subunit [Rubrivivax sp. A210]|uniref:efflux RND transporter periplasmic adaptor subunit n=1 Tax=Rubrivivax sp. A210 TaxID=2772301 RepID=UPI00191946D9|nr:efflux RND transporter periplasmic adaptor subunit [Rubrivivax sp. A210]